MANDAKAGAVVVADDKKFYYVDGLVSWDKKFYGKKVKVTGERIIENNVRHKNDTAQVQEIVGIKRIIKKPKWTLVE